MKKTLQQKIEEIQDNGYRVEIAHFRPTEYTIDLEKGETTERLISSRGGETRAEIWRDDNIVSFGEAYCSKQDNFNRKIGGLIALGRAEKKLKEYLS